MDNVLMRKFNIYCDESSVENKLPFFVIGALLIPRDQKTKTVLSVRSIKEQYEFTGKEIKWNKITSKYKLFYLSLIDYFADNNDIEFKSIIVQKSLIDMNFHNNDNELMFYKFYYQLLKRRFKSDSINYIFTDYKARSEKLRLDIMKTYLSRFQYMNSQNVEIKHLQEYDSRQIELLQLSDFFTGLVAYANNYKDSSNNSIKKELVDYVSQKFAIDLNKGTNSYFEKFNVFKWRPNSRL